MVDVSTAGSVSGKNEASASATRMAGVARSHVRAVPRAGRGEARESARADGLTDGCDHVPDFVVLELLGRRALLMDVVTLAAAEGRVHTIARHVDGLDALEVQAAL